MKKGLLLSVVASTMIFAGGDIAPVEPAAAAPAADCSDFSGSVGIAYRTQSDEENGVTSRDFFDENEIGVWATLQVEKEIAYGIGFGAKLTGYSSLGADTPGSDWSSRATFGGMGENALGEVEYAQLSRFYLTASFGNTAVKAGRFALPKKLSPLVWTDTIIGDIDDTTFEGVLVANTDLADTTVYGLYAHSTFKNSTRSYINARGADDELGLFALGFRNTSIANTTITAIGYYVPIADFVGDDDYSTYAAAVTADTSVSGFDLSVAAAYVGGDDEISPDATFGIGAKLGGAYDTFKWNVMATYVNDGDYSFGQNPFYTDSDYKKYDNVSAYAIGATVSTKLGMGTLYGLLEYGDWDTDTNGNDDSRLYAKVGYKFNISGINAKAEYRYYNTEIVGNDNDRTNQQIRVEAAYKF